MKYRKSLIALLLSLTILSFIQKGYCLSETFYLEADPYHQGKDCVRTIGVQCVIGDIIHWNFKSYQDEFLVKVSYKYEWSVKILSNMTYSDSGLVYINGYCHDTAYFKDVCFSFVNVDTVGGYIKVSFTIITPYIILFSIIGVCSVVLIIVLLIYRKHKRKT